MKKLKIYITYWQHAVANINLLYNTNIQPSKFRTKNYNPGQNI